MKKDQNRRTSSWTISNKYETIVIGDAVNTFKLLLYSILLSFQIEHFSNILLILHYT